MREWRTGEAEKARSPEASGEGPGAGGRGAGRPAGAGAGGFTLTFAAHGWHVGSKITGDSVAGSGPAVAPSQGLEKKMILTFQRYVILDAEDRGQGSLKAKRDLCWGFYRLGRDCPA